MSINISVDIDILIDADSINLYRTKSKQISLSEDQLREIMLIGTCGTNYSTSCETIVDELIEFNKSDLKLPGGSLTPEDESVKKCEILGKLKTTKIDYYLAYIFDQKAGSIGSIGDSNEINGQLILTPYKPESASGQYGGKEPPTAFPCDPCEQAFKKLQYNDEAKIKEMLKKSKTVVVNHDWSQQGYSETNPIRNWNGEITTEQRTVSYTDAYGKPKTETRIDIVNNKYYITGSKWGGIGLISKYDGFNKWLYSKYYGGEQYSLVKKLGDEEPKVGIDLGKVFTIEATIIDDPKTKGRPGLDIKNLVRITVTSGGTLDMYVKQGKALGLKVLSNTTGKKIPPYINIQNLDKYTDELRSGKLKLSTEIFPMPEEVKNSIEIDCCPYRGSDTYDIKLKVTNKGRKMNLPVSIDTIQRAQGGIYNKDLRIPSRDDPSAPNPCCEECNYCIFGNLCPGLEGVLQGIRDAEIQMRDHDATPYADKNYMTGDTEFKTARNPGPQCIAYDLYSGSPVPLADFGGY